jgi:hypothetical protein
MGLDGPFDLVLDLGCFHSLPSDGRDAYAAGVGSLTATGAVLLMFAFAARLPWSLVGTGVTPGEIRDRFAPWFDLVEEIRGKRPRGGDLVPTSSSVMSLELNGFPRAAGTSFYLHELARRFRPFHLAGPEGTGLYLRKRHPRRSFVWPGYPNS